MQDFVLSLDYLKDSPRLQNDGRFCLFEEGQIVVPEEGLDMTFREEQTDCFKAALLDSPVHICGYDDQHFFAQQLTAGTAEQHNLQTKALRAVALQDEILFAIMGRGMQLINWRQNHRFCGYCGAATAASDTEHAVHCLQCERSFYPKIMPCVMALVTKGEQCLLAVHHGRATSRYTALAGFIEAGESAEHAVYREVLEEVGIRTGRLSYFSSQSWPFPGQLMLAFYAEYLNGEITLDEKEIADARWFTALELLDFENIPPGFTISGQLIRAFAEANIR